MRFDCEIFLLSTTTSTNELGDAVSSVVKRQTFAEKKSVRQSEFYQAAATGMKPEFTFLVWREEYAGESQLEYKETTYNIIRTFATNDNEMELVCAGLAKGVS